MKIDISTQGGNFWDTIAKYDRPIQWLIMSGLAILFIMFVYTHSFATPPETISTKWFKLPISNEPPITHGIGYLIGICGIRLGSALLELVLKMFDSWKSSRFSNQ